MRETEESGEKRARATHYTKLHPSGHIDTNDLGLHTAYLLDEVPHQPHHTTPGGVRAAVDEVAPTKTSRRPSGCASLPS